MLLQHVPHPHVGLRAVKTALAVTLALLICRLFNSQSPVFAGLGAIIAMTRVVRDSLQEGRTQFVAVLLGGAVATLLLLIDPTPSPLLIGAGTLLVISLCCTFKLFYAVSLAALIVISTCVSTSGSVLAAMGYRLVDTSIGLASGILINALIKPYNNRGRVLAQLHKLLDSVPAYLDDCVLHARYPDLSDYESGLHSLTFELDIYARQLFRQGKSHDQDVQFLRGLVQLAERIYQELWALGCMDVRGLPTPENLARLEALGLETGQPAERRCAEADAIVTNYHLEKILEAHSYLLELLEEA